MIVGLPIPAAQYLRMSTEHQQYSTENQAHCNEQYAQSQGFTITRTYRDSAKSGLSLKGRPGLRELLKDVAEGHTDYKAILVYDVSRWGRFQDTDEAAHYEFVCKSAGIPVHYCAEKFTNDGSLPSSIIKALKRAMAGEFSRELGVKVLAGQKRLAQRGFKQGGSPGYGLRRMLVTANGAPKQELAAGERKSLATDRVTLVRGPAHEVQIVQDIYRLFVSEKLSVSAVARELNRRRVPYISASEWDYQAVYTVLTSPKYTGCHVFGRTSSRLSTRSVRLPRSEWVLAPGAFEGIVDTPTFSDAQRVLQGRTINKSNEEVLDSLRTLLASEGRLSLNRIKNSPGVPSPSTYRLRFGSLRRAYEIIGYGRPDQFGPIDLRRKTQALRGELMAQIVALSPEPVSVVSRGGRWRTQLRLEDGLMVSILVARSVRPWKQTVRWQIDPVERECGSVTLVARLDEENCSFLDFHIFHNIDRWRRFNVTSYDPWLNRGLPLIYLRDFCRVVATARLG